jgi:hypothetical protein
MTVVMPKLKILHTRRGTEFSRVKGGGQLSLNELSVLWFRFYSLALWTLSVCGR